MTELDPELTLEVAGNEIAVTLPGSRYSVIYFKRRGSSGLLAKDMVSKNDQRFPRMTASQFLRKKPGPPPTTRRVSSGGSFRLRDIAGLSGPELILEHFAKPHCAQTGEA